MTNYGDLYQDSVSAIRLCRTRLDIISNSCCMPDRSTYMQFAFELLVDIENISQSDPKDEEAAHGVIKNIGDLGTKLGYLYATCCTEERESLYREIFKQLNRIHGNMWQILGHGH